MVSNVVLQAQREFEEQYEYAVGYVRSRLSWCRQRYGEEAFEEFCQNALCWAWHRFRLLRLCPSRRQSQRARDAIGACVYYALKDAIRKPYGHSLRSGPKGGDSVEAYLVRHPIAVVG